LYLAEIGVIKPDSEEAKELPPIDYQKRLAAWKEKKLKLANPNFHVNKFRLSVRSIPKDITEKELKQIFKNAAKQGASKGLNTIIKQAKIVPDKKSQQINGKNQSSGFGFVEFEVHEAALNALHNTNNTPGIFKNHPNRRLIVEFAIDNAKKLEIRRDKMKRQEIRRGRLNLEFQENSQEGNNLEQNIQTKLKKMASGKNQNSKYQNSSRKNGNQYKKNREQQQQQPQKKKPQLSKETQPSKKRKFSESSSDRPKKYRRTSNQKRIQNKERSFNDLVKTYSGKRPTKKWDQ